MKPRFHINVHYKKGEDCVHIFLYALPTSAACSNLMDVDMTVEHWRAYRRQLTEELEEMRVPRHKLTVYTTRWLELEIEYRRDIVE